MEDSIYLNNLYDYYGELLTVKQQQYFEDYYWNNLTLSEIAENNNISRNAIHKQLKETVEKLCFYEEKLKLYQKRNQIKQLINELDEEKQSQIMDLI